MSDSTTTEQAGGAPAPAEEYRPSHVLSSEPEAPEPPPEPTADAAPAEGEPPKETDEQRWERERHEYNRRLGQVTKQKYLERERANQAQRELAELRARLQQGQPADGQAQNGVPPDWLQHPQVRAAIEAQAAEQARVAAFLNAGAAEYPDWDKRRAELIEMGADAGIAQLLVEMPNGHRVAGALYDDPAELERIADLKTERARAVALGAFAARIEARRTAPPSAPPRRASNLSAPIQPPSAARSRGEPNPNGSMEEYERWSKQQNWRNR